MNRYKATVTREGRWWMIRVPAVDGLTQADRLGEVEEQARSLIATTLDVAEDSFDVDLDIDVQGVGCVYCGEPAHEVLERPKPTPDAAKPAPVPVCLSHRRQVAAGILALPDQ